MSRHSGLRWCILSGVFALPLLGADAPDCATPSALEKDPEGWVDLLKDVGPDLTGWTRGPIPPTGKLNPKSQWSFDPKTGILLCEGNGGHEWLRWDKEMADGIFHVEWRFTPVPGKKGYNSGIYARNSADASTWHQAQTGDASGGFLFGESPVSGTLKRQTFAKQLKAQPVKPAGEWNTFEITSKGHQLTLWANGHVSAEWPACEAPKGYVGLEAEGWKIEFRNVKLKDL